MPKEIAPCIKTITYPGQRLGTRQRRDVRAYVLKKFIDRAGGVVEHLPSTIDLKNRAGRGEDRREWIVV